ncbi:hypothetical protein MPSEU_000724800 [Mayamaea pseudoterrestris]|nr:hypothetical protein MPSEU_000724800 [Mayamaea pseudoterrestris]
MGTGTKAFPSDVSLPAQVKALATILDYEFGKDTQVDIAGFSMGGRIGLAAACLLHGRIRKLHVTGVGLQTSERAQVHYHAWKELLRQENLQGFAWSLLMSSYHASFLLQHQNHLVSWAESLSGSHMHKPQGLLALLEQTHNPEWSVENMASQLPGTCKIHLVVGQNDQMASLGSVQALSAKLNLSEDLLTVVSTCGHAVPMESPRIWRNSILQFLDDA